MSHKDEYKVPKMLPKYEPVKGRRSSAVMCANCCFQPLPARACVVCVEQRKESVCVCLCVSAEW